MRLFQSVQTINRTGLALNPELARELVEGALATTPSSQGNASDTAQVRIVYAQKAEPIGSMPPPTSAQKKAPSKQQQLFLDKLGERLAFERSGTRLYEALISKFDAYGTWKGGPSRKDLEHIRDEEKAHFMMLQDAIAMLGGDSTAVTPSADLHAVASKGLCAVLTDPRTTLQQGMEAVLIAELVDNDCWLNLSNLAEQLGETKLANQFREALEEEEEHLLNVRTWLASALGTPAPIKVSSTRSQSKRGTLLPTARKRTATKQKSRLSKTKDSHMKRSRKSSSKMTKRRGGRR